MTTDSDECASFWKSLGLDNRVCWALSNAGIRNVAQLHSYGRWSFIRLPNIGKKSVKLVDEVIGWPEPNSGPSEIRPEVMERIACADELSAFERKHQHSPWLADLREACLWAAFVVFQHDLTRVGALAAKLYALALDEALRGCATPEGPADLERLSATLERELNT